jgi:hypothetical protein
VNTEKRDSKGLKVKEIKFMRSAAGYIPLGRRRNDILEEHKAQPVEKEQHNVNKNSKIMLAGMKILYTQNNSLTSDLPEKKKHDG